MRLQAASLSVLALVAVLASGCGSSAKKAASTSTPTTTAASTTAAPATTTAVTTTGGTSSFAGTEDCAKLSALGAEIAKAIQPGANLESLIASERTALATMAKSVPAEIRSDFQTFVAAFDAYAQAIVKLGLKPGATPSAAQLSELAQAAKGFSTPKLQQAEQHLATWAQQNCGIGTTTTG